MFKIIFVVLLASSTFCERVYPKGLVWKGRIVGGSPTSIEKFPHQISLRYYGSHRCGGSIIKMDVILIAAHCTLGIRPSFFQIIAGVTSLSKDKGLIRQVKSKKEHENFDVHFLDNDVALLWLEEGLSFGKTVQPISLASAGEKLKPGTMVRITGWGTLRFGGSEPDQLQAVYVTVVGNKECEEMYDAASPITESMMCAGEPFGGKGACQGDSGGAVIAGNKIYGIVSHGVECALAEYPGVNADVGFLRPWIDSKLSR